MYPLPRLRRKALPQHICFVDTETVHTVTGGTQFHRLKLGWCCFFRQRADVKKPKLRWEYFEDAHSLCRAISEEVNAKTCLYIFAHNVFFDLQASQFYTYFQKLGWKLEFNYEQGLTYILAIRNGKKTIKIVSTTNYFPCKLEQLGELIGISKHKVDFKTVTDAELKIYCKRDVEILIETMIFYFEFIKKHDLGGFAFTRASQAFNAFRYSFLKKRIWVHKEKHIIKLERNAYFGGRTECFRFGKQQGAPFYTLDINSQYPDVMRNNKVPVKLVDYLINPTLDYTEELLGKYLAVADVDLITPLPAYPTRQNKKIIFPIGRFSTFLCTEGLKYAIKHNHLYRVRQLAIYEGAYIFKKYINTLYKLRMKYKKEDNFIVEQFCKYIMLSLYGKFGQKFRVKKKEHEPGEGYYRIEDTHIETGETRIIYHLFNTKVTETQEEKEGRYNMVSICAHITEYGRFALWRYLQIIGTNRVLYCDTDSLKIKQSDLKHFEAVMDETKLGALKIEDMSKELKILGAKYYVTENVRRIKGVPHSAVEVEPNIFEYDQFLKEKSHMKAQVKDAVMVKRIRKKVVPKYDKGIVNPDGSISPFRLESF